jgi:hypothetical protein
MGKHSLVPFQVRRRGGVSKGKLRSSFNSAERPLHTVVDVFFARKAGTNSVPFSPTESLRDS